VFQLVGALLPDSSTHLSFTLDQPLRVKDPRIRTVYVVLDRGAGIAPDTVDMDLQTVADGRDTTAVTVYGDCIVPRRDMDDIDRAEVSVVTPSNHLVFSTSVIRQDANPVVLRPFYQYVNDSAVVLGTTVRRLFVPDGEYLPSRENVRVHVRDSSGSVVWQSDEGLMFSTMITTVEPQEPGAMATVQLTWSGRTSSGRSVPTGNYVADIMIPARPFPYQTSLSFPWPR
jgi:hypothetical protein